MLIWSQKDPPALTGAAMGRQCAGRGSGSSQHKRGGVGACSVVRKAAWSLRGILANATSIAPDSSLPSIEAAQLYALDYVTIRRLLRMPEAKARAYWSNSSQLVPCSAVLAPSSASSFLPR